MVSLWCTANYLQSHVYTDERQKSVLPELYDVIYKEGSGPLFRIGYSTVYRFISRRVPRLKQQAAHVLRHTFASYYMMNGGNIIALQRILGHVDIKQTMRYAHLAPDHLEDVVSKNPLTSLRREFSAEKETAESCDTRTWHRIIWKMRWRRIRW